MDIIYSIKWNKKNTLHWLYSAMELIIHLFITLLHYLLHYDIYYCISASHPLVRKTEKGD